MPILIILILLLIVLPLLKAASRDLERQSKWNAYQQQRREQMEDIDYQLKFEQVEALRRQNKKPPQNPFELT